MGLSSRAEEGIELLPISQFTKYVTLSFRRSLSNFQLVTSDQTGLVLTL